MVWNVLASVKREWHVLAESKEVSCPSCTGEKQNSLSWRKANVLSHLKANVLACQEANVLARRTANVLAKRKANVLACRKEVKILVLAKRRTSCHVVRAEKTWRT